VLKSIRLYRAWKKDEHVRKARALKRAQEAREEAARRQQQVQEQLDAQELQLQQQKHQQQQEQYRHPQVAQQPPTTHAPIKTESVDVRVEGYRGEAHSFSGTGPAGAHTLAHVPHARPKREEVSSISGISDAPSCSDAGQEASPGEDWAGGESEFHNASAHGAQSAEGQAASSSDPASVDLGDSGGAGGAVATDDAAAQHMAMDAVGTGQVPDAEEVSSLGDDAYWEGDQVTGPEGGGVHEGGGLEMESEEGGGGGGEGVAQDDALEGEKEIVISDEAANLVADLGDMGGESLWGNDEGNQALF
jgi:type II secretory pathway pseudopilin PulG